MDDHYVLVMVEDELEEWYERMERQEKRRRWWRDLGRTLLFTGLVGLFILVVSLFGHSQLVPVQESLVLYGSDDGLVLECFGPSWDDPGFCLLEPGRSWQEAVNALAVSAKIDRDYLQRENQKLQVGVSRMAEVTTRAVNLERVVQQKWEMCEEGKIKAQTPGKYKKISLEE